VNAIKNGWEEAVDAPRSGAPTSVMDECNMEQVKSVLEHMHSISCTTFSFLLMWLLVVFMCERMSSG